MQFKWNQKNAKMILLGCILDKGRWSCFLVLGGMRLCVLIFFFLPNELQDFSHEQQARHV